LTISMILIYLALTIALLNSVAIFLLWRSNLKHSQRLGFLSSTTQRLDRELGQHRYAMAMLRQLHGQMHDPPEEIRSDTELLDAAVTQLDEAAASVAAAEPATEQTAKTTASQAPVGELKDSEILQSIRYAVKNNALTLHQQPIVTLPNRETRYYELFARIMVGDKYIPAKSFVSVAKSNNLIEAIDNLLLLHCLQLLKKSPQEPNTQYFINISAQTFNNKKYMHDLIEFLAANPKLSSRLVFEMTQEDSLKLTSTTRSVMEGLALLGCRFSMDQVTIFGMDVNRLMDQHISFVKLDAKALCHEMDAISTRKRIKKIKNTLDSQGVTVILEKVENEKQLFILLDLHADYGQGYLFGAPVPVQ